MLDPGAEWDRAMRRGDFDGAWAITAALLGSPSMGPRDDPGRPYHLRWVWDGRPFAGRHVLVRCYHGLGDTLQFARYLPALRAAVRFLTVEAQPELVGLLGGLGCIDRLIPFVQDAPAVPSECDIEIMELPFALRLRPEQVPPPFLGCYPRRLAEGAVGLCWSAGGWDPARSVPQALFAGLTAHPCVTLAPLPTSLRVLNPEGCPTDLVETAAIVAGLDRVITVDTMIAHLAGTLGRPTWLLLKHDADWRWMEGRVDSPWYPQTRLYRQTRPGDWDAVMARVASDWRGDRCEGP